MTIATHKTDHIYISSASRAFHTQKKVIDATLPLVLGRAGAVDFHLLLAIALRAQECAAA